MINMFKDEFSLSSGVIDRIKKNKNQLKVLVGKENSAAKHVNIKRAKLSVVVKYKDVGENILKFLQEKEKNEYPVTDPMLQHAALRFAQKIGKTSFCSFC